MLKAPLSSQFSIQSFVSNLESKSQLGQQIKSQFLELSQIVEFLIFKIALKFSKTF